MRDVIRRVTAFAGLIALVPVGLMLLEGRIGFEDAGTRAALTLLGVIVARMLLTRVARSLARQSARVLPD